MKNVKDMTKGSPAGLIFTFAIPLMLGNLFQQLYTVADSLIVSRGVGVDALASLGSIDWYLYLVLGTIQGITQGFAILIAQRFGAGDRQGLKRAYRQSMLLSAGLGLLLTLCALLSVPPVLNLLQVPEGIRPMSRTYAVILFLGVPAQMLFNFTASMLRALGDSRTPLQAMTAASLFNIGMDLVFVMVFRLGVAGAAAATVMAQLLSGLWCLRAMFSVEEFRPGRLKVGEPKETGSGPAAGTDPRKAPHNGPADSDKEPGLNGKLLRLCTPLVLQNVLISVGGMIVIHVVNGFGVSFIAGYTATNKLYGALEGAGIAYGYAMVTYTGQNYGAGRWDRIRAGYKAAMLIGAGTSFVIGAAMVLFGHQIGTAFLPGSTARVLEARQTAYQYLLIMGICLPILYVLHVTRSTLQGLGDTVMTMVSGIAEFLMRTFMALFISRYLGGTSIMYGEVAAWLGADLVLAGSLIRHFRGGGETADRPPAGAEDSL